MNAHCFCLGGVHDGLQNGNQNALSAGLSSSSCYPSCRFLQTLPSQNRRRESEAIRPGAASGLRVQGAGQHHLLSLGLKVWLGFPVNHPQREKTTPKAAALPKRTSVSMPSLPPPTCGECLGSAPASYESEEQEALAPVRGVRGWGASPGWRNHSFGKASLRKKPLGDVATVCPASFSTRCPAFAFSSSPSASSAYRIS